MTDIKKLIQAAKRPEITTDICLRGDLAARYDELTAQLSTLPRKDALGGDPDRRRIHDELDSLRAEMADATVTFRLRALPPADYQALRDEHPPRRDGDDLNPFDASYGFNVLTFFRPLIQACVVEPELDAEDWKLLFDEGLSSGQFERLGMRAWRANERTLDVPFSSADSEVTPS